MVGKVYFCTIAFFIVFSNYYQSITTASYGVFDYLYLVRDAILILGGFCYFFEKRIGSSKNWKYVWWFLLGHLGLSLVRQILPGSYYGNLEDGQILVNIFVFALTIVLVIPLYYAVYKLQIASPSKKGKKK